MNRKQRRIKQRSLKKNKKLNELDTKMGLFELIPEDCILCHAAFDKKDKEMVSTWRVSVREKEKTVKVYCPPCWEKAQNLLDQLGINTDENQQKNKD